MAETTGISWTDHTFNPWTGCTRVSPGCDNCYAEVLARRAPKNFGGWEPGADRKRTSAEYWKQPRRWNRSAAERGQRARVFCASMADVFDNRAPVFAREDLFELIRETPSLDWQLLTKRPQNIDKMLPPDWGSGYSNVWLGTTVENQEEADRRIPHLLDVQARVRFLSCEPLLGPIDLRDFRVGVGLRRDALSGFGGAEVHVTGGFANAQEALRLLPKVPVRSGSIDWVIIGGESGGGARPTRRFWARSLIGQCRAAGVPVWFKQTGSARDDWPGVTRKGDDPKEWPTEFRVQEMPR